MVSSEFILEFVCSFSLETSFICNCFALGTTEGSFPLQKKEITKIHRHECVSIVERIFGARLIVDGDLIIINFFALVTSSP